MFVLEAAEGFHDAPRRKIEMARGAPISYPRLLEMQRMHAAQHYRQVIVHFEDVGRPVPSFRPEQIGIKLPARIF